MTDRAFSPAVLRDPRVRLAGVALVAAVVVFGAAIVGAVRVGVVSATAPPPMLPDSALTIAAPGRGTNIAEAVGRDLFTDDRQPPPRRYLMPGETDRVAEEQPRPVVLGTALGSDGQHFATCLLPGGQATIVRAGGRIGAYTVVSIERGKVHFRSADGERFTLDASKP